MNYKKNSILLLLNIIALVVYGALVNPKASTMLATVGFLAILLGIFFQILNMFISLVLPAMTPNKRYVLSVLYGFVPVYLMALSSLSNLSLLDLVFIVLTVSIISWYLNKTIS